MLYQSLSLFLVGFHLGLYDYGTGKRIRRVKMLSSIFNNNIFVSFHLLGIWLHNKDNNNTFYKPAYIRLRQDQI